MTQLRAPGRVAREKHRYALAERLFERGLGVDIDDGYGDTPPGGQRPQRVEHLVTEMATGAPQQRQPHRRHSPLLILSVEKNSCSPRRNRNVTEAPFSIFVSRPLIWSALLASVVWPRL